ncbi:maleylacetate reductase [uncultured Sphingosinicella sp.]|uniref:maleylacetate reductase n=1 Tax=uncultured Sphingosinicella sp. TaxID=478748 RepID=UPI0030D8530F|tara:strand:+ start:32611 stop:33693 length:1083 start_codon:yes stop_codon:yes gene_type:complete
MNAVSRLATSSFTHDVSAQRVIFGFGKRSQLAEEVERLGCQRALVISSAPQKDQALEIAGLIGTRSVGVYPYAEMHTPVDVTERAVSFLVESRVDCLVAFGGGSAIGLTKALALRTRLPQIALPTTFAGSEMTPILGQTEHGVKTTLRENIVLPRTVIYDPKFVETLPVAVAGPSGMNSIAHAVEALYAENHDPIVDMWAEESIGALGRALPVIATGYAPADAWAEALYGAWLGGACLGMAGMAIHHKLCHILGGSYNLPHADIHCLLICYAAAYNRCAAPEAMGRIARALNAQDAPQGLYYLMLTVGSVKSLQAFGLTPADLDHVAEMAVANPYYNPAPVTKDGVRALLEAAYFGSVPY